MNPVAILVCTSLWLAQSPGHETTIHSLPQATQESKPAAAQQTKNQQEKLARRFEKARLLERVERNPKAAAELFRSLTTAAGASKDLRARSWLRLGICLDQLGKKDEARLAYQQAATSSTLVAAEAQARMQGQDPKRLEYRVRLQIDKLLRGKDLEAAKRDLLWIGEDSVPFLIAAIEEQKLDLDFVVRATGILLALDGPKTVSFLEKTSRSKDTLLRRALVRGFTSKVAPELVPAMSLYLEDPDEKTREEALHQLLSLVPTSRILDFLETGSEYTQKYLVGRYQPAPGTTHRQTSRSNRWQWQYEEARGGDNADRMLALLQRWYGAKPRPDFLIKGNSLVRDWVLWQNLLSRPQGWATLALAVRKTTQGGQLPGYLGWSSQLAPSPAWILSLAESLPPFPHRVPKDLPYEKRVRQDWLMQQLRSLLGDQGRKPILGHEFLEVLPQLAALDYDSQGLLSSAIQKLAQPKDLRLVIELIPRLYSTPHLVWISEQTPSVDLLPAYRKALAYIWEQRKSRGNRFTNDSLPRMLYQSLLRCQEPDIARFLVRETEQHPILYRVVAPGLLSWRTVPEESLERLLVSPNPPLEAYVWGERSAICIYLAKAGRPGMGQAFARAEALGMRLPVPQASAKPHFVDNCFQYLLARNARGESSGYLHGYDEAAMSTLLRDYLGEGLSSSWTGAVRVINAHRSTRSVTRGRTGIRYRLTNSVLASIIDSLPGATRGNQEQARQSISRLSPKEFPALASFYRWLLASKEPRYQAQALSGMPTDLFPDIGESCLAALASEEREVQSAALRRLAYLHYTKGYDKVLTFLRSSAGMLRAQAVQTLLALDPKRTPDDVSSLIRDDSYSVRLAVIAACRKSLDPKYTPTLLIGLQDSVKQVREAAQAALDAIRFYHEQKSFWDAWSKRKKLGYASPATALLSQAQKDQPKKIRIQAIRALGTMADPGSLPFLIQLMKEDDPEIQKVAEQALDRINDQKH